MTSQRFSSRSSTRCLCAVLFAFFPLGSVSSAYAEVITLAQLLGPGQTFIMDESLQEHLLQIEIIDAVWQQAGEVQLLTPATAGPPAISDIIQFFNAGNPPHTNVVFASDDEDGNLPPLQPLPITIAALEGAPLVVVVPGFDAKGAPVLIEATIFSDTDPQSTISDSITLRIIPEPGAFTLLAIGLVGLVAFKRRCRR